MNLLPLETLPGWPEAPEVSNAWMFLLLFGLPLVAGVLISFLSWVPKLHQRYQADTAASNELVPARRDDLQRPDAYEMVDDAAARHQAIEEGEDTTPRTSPLH